MIISSQCVEVEVSNFLSNALFIHKKPGDYWWISTKTNKYECYEYLCTLFSFVSFFFPFLAKLSSRNERMKRVCRGLCIFVCIFSLKRWKMNQSLILHEFLISFSFLLIFCWIVFSIAKHLAQIQIWYVLFLSQFYGRIGEMLCIHYGHYLQL